MSTETLQADHARLTGRRTQLRARVSELAARIQQYAQKRTDHLVAGDDVAAAAVTAQLRPLQEDHAPLADAVAALDREIGPLEARLAAAHRAGEIAAAEAADRAALQRVEAARTAALEATKVFACRTLPPLMTALRDAVEEVGVARRRIARARGQDPAVPPAGPTLFDFDHRPWSPLVLEFDQAVAQLRASGLLPPL
jgi:chromosome segregation ATPase